MHVLFRTLTQQMGMQKVRAILPDTIDTYLNQAIQHIVQLELQTSANKMFKENVVTQRSKISTVNSLSTLSTFKTIAVSLDKDEHCINLDTIQDVLYYIGFSVSLGLPGFTSCRLIESDKLEETIADYCNRDSLRNPVVTMYNIKDTSATKGVQQCFLYTGGHNNRVNFLKVDYIKVPAKVKLVTQGSSENVDCDLPEYLHTNIVETAMEFYMLSLGLTSNKQQSQESGKQLQ